MFNIDERDDTDNAAVQEKGEKRRPSKKTGVSTMDIFFEVTERLYRGWRQLRRCEL
jgi:hypothetical protein